MLAYPDSFTDPYEEYTYESNGTTISREAYKLRQEVRVNGESTQTLKNMTELIVEIASANTGRTDTTDKVNFEYNRHYHNQIQNLIELLQSFQDASHTTPAELQGLVMHRINAQIADLSDAGSQDSTDSKLWHVLHTKFDQFVGEIQQEIVPYCDSFYMDTPDHMGPWVTYHVRDWFCDFRDLLVDLLVTIMKYKAAGRETWARRKRHYRLCTAIMKVMTHMYDVPTGHRGTNMSYKTYKDPLNRRAKYLKDKRWMQLLEDTVWIVLCARYTSNYEDATIFRVDPRVVSMIGAYRAALEARHQKTPADLLVNFARTQEERRENSQTEQTRNALLELQALCNAI